MFRRPWGRLALGTRGTAAPEHFPLLPKDLVWAMGALCALNQKPFSADLLLRQLPPPYGSRSLQQAARALGFESTWQRVPASLLVQRGSHTFALLRAPAPATGAVAPEAADAPPACRAVLVQQVSATHVLCFSAGASEPQQISLADFERDYLGSALRCHAPRARPTDPDASSTGQAPAAQPQPTFGLRWFVPYLLKHRGVWRDVLLASLVIQLLALGTPLFTQSIIDKVVVHRTESTLAVIAVGLLVFMVFSAALTWVRQYLVLHTGNRVDAVLMASVFEHLLHLPPRYFEKRPTGVIAARLHGVETIREFIASAAVTLVLDLPFLLIFVGIMFWYSVKLTLLALAILGIIAAVSAVVAPIFQAQLNQQFLLGARNQGFLTEHIAGIETVKSLQMEPRLKQRFGDYLADYLHATFKTRQLGNTYNTVAGTLEQLMSVLILLVGAYTVMTSDEFTIGMLVAFQMFAGKLSQPMMRLVGLWQQFQQARLSVQRLGDLMNAPTEPYAALPARQQQGQGHIQINDLAFRHGDKHPWLYRHFQLEVPAGACVAIMGPSGSGKSTLAKLLQGFYLPGEGSIRIDGTDIQNLSVNELRSHFGVVPQETVLFSGTVYDNLLAANPHASFEQIVQATRIAEIHDAIEQLPNGYQTEIGERGAGLSGGQRQRLAIARALLKRPKVLIFDEATSALDAATAEHFATTINQLRGKVSMLFITHALPRSLKVDALVQLKPVAAAEGAPPTP